MKRLLPFICILSFLVSSCVDDLPSDNPSHPDVDKFVGNHKVVRLGAEAENLDFSNVVLCYMIAPNDSIISRKATVTKEKYGANVTFEVGLIDGIYRMLYFQYEVVSECRVLFFWCVCVCVVE